MVRKNAFLTGDALLASAHTGGEVSHSHYRSIKKIVIYDGETKQ